MSSQIWQSTEDTGPYGSFPQYPQIETNDNSGRGLNFTPGSKLSADTGVFGTLEFDNIKFKNEIVFDVAPVDPNNAPATTAKTPTIQTAIDQLDGLGPVNARITLSPGTYFESLHIDRTNSSPAADGASRTQVQVIGDTRPCAGMTLMTGAVFTRLGNTGPSAVATGSDGIPIQVSIDGIGMSVILNGETEQIDFVALGVVPGDVLILRDPYTIAYERIVAFADSNYIEFTETIGEFYNSEGTSVTICPNVVVTPTMLYAPGVDISGSCVSFTGIRFKTDPARTSFVSHVMRATKSTVYVHGCMFDDFCGCAFEDCIGLFGSQLNASITYPGVRIYTNSTVVGGFNNNILAVKSHISADTISTISNSTAHNVALVSSTFTAVSHVAHNTSAGVQLYASNKSTVKLSRASYVGWFMGILAQYGSHVHLGGAVDASGMLGRTLLQNHYIATHARGGSNIDVDGEFTAATAVTYYLTSGSNMTFAPTSTRYVAEYWWYGGHFVMSGCKLTIADRESPTGNNSAIYDENIDGWWGWWRPLRSDVDSHILDSDQNLVVVVQPWRNDYMGNYPYLGRIFTVVCKRVDGQHVLLLDSGVFGGNGVDYADNMNIAVFTGTEQFITFCVIDYNRTLVVASKGVSFTNGW